MSGRKMDLALAFLTSQPAGAAAVLELCPAGDVAELLRQVPLDQAAAVLQNMLPQYVADICEQLELPTAAGLLTETDTDFVVAVLRYSNRRWRRKLLEHLPERTRMTCSLLLQYSEEAVGAWMEVGIMTLPDGCTVEEARERLASELTGPESEVIYVVDRARKIRGVVGMGSLFRAEQGVSVSSIMTASPEAVSGRASLVSVAGHPVWAHRDTVAVVNRKRELVGMLRHVDMRRGLGLGSKTIDRARVTGPVSGAVEIYGNSLLALFGTVCEAVALDSSRGDQR